MKIFKKVQKGATNWKETICGALGPQGSIFLCSRCRQRTNSMQAVNHCYKKCNASICDEFLAFSRRVLSMSSLNNSTKVVFVAIMIMNYSKNDEATCQQVFIHIMLPCAQSLQKKFLI